MKPRTIFRLVLVVILVALFVRNYLTFSRIEKGSRESVQWVDVKTFGRQTATPTSRDLLADEARGGHTLQRHVGKTDSELRQRLSKERVSAASSYADRATAQSAVGSALTQNRDRIEAWQNRPGGHSNLVLDYSSDKSLGRTLHRGELDPQPCSHSVVVLKWLPPKDYFVVTSYPQCGSAHE